jgi:hypothetical protein
MKLLFFCSFVCLMFFNSTCQPKNKLGDVAKVAFGSSGGVTAFKKQYELIASGKLTLIEGQITGNKNSKYVKTLSQKEMREIAKKLESLKLEEVKFNNPGNMSYFLNIIKNDSTKNEITWGGSDTVPPKVREFYEFLLSKVN